MYTQDLLLFRRWLSRWWGRGGETRVYFLTRTRGRIALGSCNLCCSRLAFLQPQDIVYLIVFVTCFISILKESRIDSQLCPCAPCMWCIAQLCCRTDFNRASFLAGFAVLRCVWEVWGSDLMRSAIWIIIREEQRVIPPWKWSITDRNMLEA